MCRKRWVEFCLVSLVFILTIVFAQNDSLAVEKKTLSWGSTSTTSGAFTLFVVVSKVLNDKIPEINVTVRSTGASLHNARLFEKNEIDMGGIDTRTAWQANQGKGPFEGKRGFDLRLLSVLLANNALQFVVSEKSGVKDIYGLDGKPFTPGMLGSSAEQLTALICALFGVHPKIRHSNYADAIEAMKNEMIVGFGKATAPDSSVLEIMSAMKIRILSFSDDEIAKIERNVEGLSKVVLPAGLYRGLGEINTVETQWGNWVKKDFSEELAYKIVKAMWENRADIKKSYPSFADQVAEKLSQVKGDGLYLHRGAVKFYREVGMTVPKSLIPPEMGEK